MLASLTRESYTLCGGYNFIVHTCKFQRFSEFSNGSRLPFPWIYHDTKYGFKSYICDSKYRFTSELDSSRYGSLDTHNDNINKVLQQRSHDIYESLVSYPKLRLGMSALSVQRTLCRDSHKSGPDGLRKNEIKRLMDVGVALLKEGEQGFDGGLEVGVSEQMLKEAAAVFASASAIDPSFLVAISSWGDALLALGKLKLLLSEELRDMLLEARGDSARRTSANLSKITSLERAIPKVCEECEDLLVEAGRKYYNLLSKDNANDHARHNWGLALFYRARLVAADGQKDSYEDAIKIYSAAIDKFEATASLSNQYSSSAFLHWGLALRDQSWLHPVGTNERHSLLDQARQVIEKALQAYPSCIQTKLALASCIDDLVQLQQYKE